MIQTIRLGSTGPLVEQWQFYLRGIDLYQGEATGKFDAATAAATKQFQLLHRLTPDGIAGNQTFGRAMVDGFTLVSSEGSESQRIEQSCGPQASPNWPPKPDGLRHLTPAERSKLFGQFAFRPAPIAGNPEAIVITDNWVKDNLVTVTIPQLVGVFGAQKNGKVTFHRLAAKQLVDLFAAWEKAGLIHLVKSWAGSWSPRFIRGSKSILSNHATATAFDINAPWNGLARRPALVGEAGSVRELVPLALEYGFFWGGWWGYSGGGRADGMHFEVCAIL